MVLQRVSLVTIGCHNLPLLRKFYQDLGWEETDHGFSDYAVFKTAGVLLSLWSVEKLTKESGLKIPDSNQYFKGITLSICVDIPEQVDETLEHVLKIGGTILTEPKNDSGSFRAGHFADPENNIWEVAYNPDATFDERGATLMI